MFRASFMSISKIFYHFSLYRSCTFPLRFLLLTRFLLFLWLRLIPQLNYLTDDWWYKCNRNHNRSPNCTFTLFHHFMPVQLEFAVCISASSNLSPYQYLYLFYLLIITLVRPLVQCWIEIAIQDVATGI